MSKTAHRLQVAEPKGAYAQRPALVADASVLAAALFGEAAGAEAFAVLRGRTLHAPHLLDHEVASVGLKKLRRERVADATVAAALNAYMQLPIERHLVTVEGVVALAQRYNLTAYDAAYLQVAESLAAPLATFDDKLAKAARAHLVAEHQVNELRR